jgi:hypothetical protein
MEDSLDYLTPVFCCQIMLFLTVEPPVTMRTVKVANIIDIDRAIHRLFFLEQLIGCYFLENANVKRHFTHKVSYASTVN